MQLLTIQPHKDKEQLQGKLIVFIKIHLILMMAISGFEIKKLKY